MEDIHTEKAKRTVALDRSTSHLAMAFHHTYKAKKKGGDIVELTQQDNEGVSRCVTTSPFRLPSVFDRRIELALLAEAQRTGKRDVEFDSIYALLRAVGRENPTKEYYLMAEKSLLALEYTSRYFDGIKRPQKQVQAIKQSLKEARKKGWKDVPERESFRVNKVIESLEYADGPVRVTLNRDLVRMHSWDGGNQIAEIDLDVIARLNAAAALNLYTFLMAHPYEARGGQPLSVQTLTRICAWPNAEKAEHQLTDDLKKTLEKISKATGTTYSVETTRNKTYRITSLEPVQPEKVRPELALANDDTGVKSSPRHRVRLVA